MASSTLAVGKCEKLLITFALAMPPRWAAKSVGVSRKTASNFYELLLMRMSDCSYFDPVLPCMARLNTEEMREFNDWTSRLLARHRGLTDELTRTAYFSKYSWLWYMGNLHGHAFLSIDDATEAVEFVAKAVAAELKMLVRATGPLNRDPYEEDCRNAFEQYVDRISVKADNMRLAMPRDALEQYVTVKDAPRLAALLDDA